ncbi:hypothetical protein [Actinospongicola halichondriae]|uniref:hypothetical protein n=1 Tax=Actinospongicola halichondriae TaxID=3236844 RepID=UPI003D5C229C
MVPQSGPARSAGELEQPAVGAATADRGQRAAVGGDGPDRGGRDGVGRCGRRRGRVGAAAAATGRRLAAATAAATGVRRGRCRGGGGLAVVVLGRAEDQDAVLLAGLVRRRSGAQRGDRTTHDAESGAVTLQFDGLTGADSHRETRLLVAAARRPDLTAVRELHLHPVAALEGDDDLAAGVAELGAGIEGGDDVGRRGALRGERVGAPLRHADAVAVAAALDVDHGDVDRCLVGGNGRCPDD